MLHTVTNLSWLLLLLTEVVLNRVFRSTTTDKQNADKHSITIIWVSIIAAITTAIYISKTMYLPIYTNSSLQYIGVAINFAGLLLRLWAVLSLGRFFTVDVTIRQHHQLKKNGLYRYLRHPSYFASLLTFIGMGFTFNNWLSFLLLVVVIVAVFIYRIRVEEKVLIGHFGEEYAAYKKATYALIPFVY